MVTRSIMLISFASLTALGGCATVQPRQSFSEIERSVADMTGYRVRWNDGSEADKAVAAELESMLTKQLTADAAVQIALLNNRHLQATYEDLGVAQADVVGAGLLKNPVFDGSVRFVEGGGSPTIDLGVAFDFIDVLFVGARKRVAEARLEAVKADVTSRVLGVAGDVTLAFYEVQAAQQTVELRQEVERTTAASYDLAQRLREAGNNRPLDVAYERALHEEARLALAAAEADLVTGRENLTRLMGLWGEHTEWHIEGRLPDVASNEISAEGLEQQVVKNSLALRSSRAEIEIALRELGITQPLAYLNELEVGASAERDDGQWEVGPSLSLPLPIFNQGQPAIARAQARLRQAQQKYYATAVDVRSTVRSLFARVQSLRQRTNYYRTVMLPLRQSIVDQSQLQYNAMQLGAFQLLQAKRDQVEAASTYVSLLRDYWSAKAQLQLGLSGRTMQTVSVNTGTGSGETSTGTSEGH